MKTMRALAAGAVIVLTTMSCDTITGIFRDASLQVTVPGGQRQIGWGEPEAPRILIDGVDDPKGLAGLEVRVGDRVFTAPDLPSSRFDVPGSGRLNFDVRLRQDGGIVAEGQGSWTLEPDVEWEIEIERGPYPLGSVTDMRDIHKPNPPCGWFWCHGIWRFEIREAALNYDGEALWVTLWRVHPDECADVC